MAALAAGEIAVGPFCRRLAGPGWSVWGGSCGGRVRVLGRVETPGGPLTAWELRLTDLGGGRVDAEEWDTALAEARRMAAGG